MLRKKVIISLVIIFSFMMIPSIQAEKLKTSQTSIILDNPLEEFFLETTIPINIIFIGFDTSNINITYIDSNLKELIKPTYNFNYFNLSIQYMGILYNLEYNYYFSDGTTLTTDFESYLNSTEKTINPPGHLMKYDKNATSAKEYSALDTITWLDNNINNYFLGINNSYCFYLIDLYTYDYISDYHY